MKKTLTLLEGQYKIKMDELLEEEMIMGYTVEGKPLTKVLYNLRLQKAEEQLNSGEFITQEELEAESDNW